MKKLIIAFAAISLMMSCKSAQSTSGTQKIAEQEKTSIENFTENNTWELVSYQGQAPSEVGFVKRIPTLIINENENKIGGNSGCNSFGGQVDIDGDIITFSKIFSTKMFCQGVPEHEYFMLLQQPLKFKTKGDILQFIKDGDVILEFKMRKNE
ncbi:META domain-containing protein [Carboxylicivirga sp. A043]|uniref:META domain-containing protein n=1 Tax=Carboxylicivirga litoralis TaxID=2816963 RepID=UPI0021CAF9C3|nr:META domain-containing protein [Carboxylicivirga sp. A043]MCU4157481.1 META domain-containing protein [Carboxylicivirga sp. A043]